MASTRAGAPAAKPAKSFPITGDADADRLLLTDPLALLLGMLLDQQVPMEWAFRGPAKLKDRLGGRLDAAEIAAMAPEDLEALFKEKPALHRFPGSMAKRAHALCTHLVEHHGGDAGAIWKGAKDAQVVYDRIRALPGYGEEKAKILLAILVKRLGMKLAGWEEIAAPFSDDLPRSAADVDSPEALRAVRGFKQRKKAGARPGGD
jgi:uncharacterized HhH-GPD family protein